MKTLVDQERRADPSLLLLNAGDDFIGTVWDHKYGSKAAAHFQNRLQPDAMVRQLPGLVRASRGWWKATAGRWTSSNEAPHHGSLESSGCWLYGACSSTS
jgi:hypothetical protein